MKTAATIRAVAAEMIGTALLLATVVGSGIMAERLAAGNGAIALLANSLATGAVLLTLIYTFGTISGAHFNPAVTIAAALDGAFPWRNTLSYIPAQILGAILGLFTAHAMFALPLIQFSTHARHGAAQMLGEFVATFGLVIVVHGTGKRVTVVPLTVAAYITAAYWFTSSTSFANPAITIARAFTNTFSGVQPADVPGFIVAQLLGALAATFVFRWLREPATRSDS